MQWEYKTIKVHRPGNKEHDRLMDSMGDDGWELISMIWFGEEYTNGCYYRAFFKRPKQSDAPYR
jgi:hypothetical protein